jgi:hypothetical protein
MSRKPTVLAVSRNSVLFFEEEKERREWQENGAAGVLLKTPLHVSRSVLLLLSVAFKAVALLSFLSLMALAGIPFKTVYTCTRRLPLGRALTRALDDAQRSVVFGVQQVLGGVTRGE